VDDNTINPKYDHITLKIKRHLIEARDAGFEKSQRSRSICKIREKPQCSFATKPRHKTYLATRQELMDRKRNEMQKCLKTSALGQKI